MRIKDIYVSVAVGGDRWLPLISGRESDPCLLGKAGFSRHGDAGKKRQQQGAHEPGFAAKNG